MVEKEKVRIVVIGRGEPTPRQLELLKKALGADVEIVATLQQVNSPKDITSALEHHGAEAVFSFILHPTVIGALQTARRFKEFDYFVASTQAVKTAEVGSAEEAERLCEELGADIPNIKVLPNGKVSVRCTKTVKLLKNPILKIEAEEEIA